MENGNDLISQQATIEMKLIDGVKLIADLRRYAHETISIDGLEGLIATQPEIIRCKDCKYYALHSLFGRSFGLCERLCNESHTILTESNDFCSHAERRKQ